MGKFEDALIEAAMPQIIELIMEIIKAIIEAIKAGDTAQANAGSSALMTLMGKTA